MKFFFFLIEICHFVTFFEDSKNEIYASKRKKNDFNKITVVKPF